MKVCLLSPLPPPVGGIATWTKVFLENKITKENQVFLVNTSAIGKRAYVDTRNIFSEIKRFKNIYKDLKKKMKFCDLLHINVSCSKLGLIKDYLCIKKAHKKDLKVLVQFHCNIEDQMVSNFQHKILKKIVSISDKLVVINNTSKEYLKKQYGTDSILIPNFIDLYKEENNHVYSELKNIVFVGNVTKTKGVNLIVDAAKIHSDLNFILVGKICEDFDTINLPKNVELVGIVDKSKVFDYLNKSDIFLFPSYTEGFPLSILEAMNEGLPCITTRVGAIPDIFEENGAFLVNFNVEEISNAINYLRDVNVRKELGKFNFCNVKTNYSSDAVISKIFNEYERLINEDTKND